ncbi:hypothetical protein BD769DRAFT_1383694 [Suillus cothurnatus]|nr:hypothetical protein BD769DRAFT_1383694 [Suillus cothurnatus]
MSHARSWAGGTRGQQSRCAAKGKASSVSTIISVDEDSNTQSAPTPAAKRKGIQWEKNYSARTSWLIAWCKANNDAHIKLFLDFVKDAKDQEGPRYETLIDSKLEKFLWWPDLHGWWRTNPAFNTTSSSADPRQDFKSAVLQYFSRSGSNNAQVPDENDPDGDNELELEEGEVDETEDTYQEGLDPVPLAEKIMEEPIDEDTIMSGPTDQFITHGSTSAIFPPFLHPHPSITPISTYSDQNVFSLNSPEPLPDDSDVQSQEICIQP